MDAEFEYCEVWRLRWRIGLTVAYMSAESKYVGKNPKPDYELVAGQSFDGCV